MQGVLMLSRVTVRDADFRRVTFDQFAPEGCTFEHCDFSNQTLDRRYQPLFSSRRQSVFRDCTFNNADLHVVKNRNRKLHIFTRRFDAGVFSGQD